MHRHRSRAAGRRSGPVFREPSFPANVTVWRARESAASPRGARIGTALLLPVTAADGRRFAIAAMAILAALQVHIVRACATGPSAQRQSSYVHADAVDRWSSLLAEASQRTGLPTVWLHDVLRAESGGNARALSPKGAIGLMQLMPATYAAMRASLGLGADPFAPRDNILAGAVYLRLLVDRYGWPGAVAAYNAGPARLEALLTRGRALPSETVAYLWTIAKTHNPSVPTAAAVRALGPGETALTACRDQRPPSSKPTLFVTFASTSAVTSAAARPVAPSRGSQPTA